MSAAQPTSLSKLQLSSECLTSLAVLDDCTIADCPCIVNSISTYHRHHATCTYARARAHMCVHVCARVHVRACVPACMHACVYACVRACVHACVRACVHACMRACMHAFGYLATNKHLQRVDERLCAVRHRSQLSDPHNAEQHCAHSIEHCLGRFIGHEWIGRLIIIV